MMDEYQEKVPLSSINELRKELRAPVCIFSIWWYRRVVNFRMLSSYHDRCLSLKKSITRALISRNLGQVEENIAKEQLYAESIIEEAVSTPHRRLTPNSTPKVRTRVGVHRSWLLDSAIFLVNFHP